MNSKVLEFIKLHRRPLEINFLRRLIILALALRELHKVGCRFSLSQAWALIVETSKVSCKDRDKD